VPVSENAADGVIDVSNSVEGTRREKKAPMSLKGVRRCTERVRRKVPARRTGPNVYGLNLDGFG
jgi:hypothetical protein